MQWGQVPLALAGCVAPCGRQHWHSSPVFPFLSAAVQTVGVHTLPSAVPVLCSLFCLQLSRQLVCTRCLVRFPSRETLAAHSCGRDHPSIRRVVETAMAVEAAEEAATAARAAIPSWPSVRLGVPPSAWRHNGQ